MYALDPATRTQYPNLTLFDLHIHAYVVGAKYDVRRLCDYAIDQYVDIARMILATSSLFRAIVAGKV